MINFKTKFKCEKCYSDVSNIKVTCHNITLTRKYDDFKLLSSDIHTGYAGSVTYTCPKCGDITMRCEGINLQDFFTKKMSAESFTKDRYGTLLVDRS